jgi:DNA polymerase III gamma/tau subunit
LVSSEEIKNLGSCLIDGDYGKTLAITDSFATVGVDFYRALLDLADFFRDRLVNDLNNESSHSYPEQVVRILDALQAGEDLVRTGLSEKTNFEVTMFRAMEAGKSRSIDQLIRRISGVLPEQVKKKTEQPLAVETPVVFDSASSSPSEEESVVESSQYDSKSYDSEKSGSTLLMAEPSPQQALPQEKTAVEDLSSDRPPEAEGGIEKTAPPRQVKDQGKIEERIATLPPALRDLLEEKFRGEFVAIEQINRDLLI